MAIINGQVISINSGKEVFIAKYGKTTYEEIKAAYDAGKACFVKDEDTGKKFATLFSISSSRCQFSYMDGNDSFTLELILFPNDNWMWCRGLSSLALETHASTHATGGSDPITPASIGAAAQSTTVTATLSAASWTGNSAPYSYSLSVSGVTTTSNQEILPALNITAEQLEALQSANIQDGGQAAGSITLKSFGDVPTIDIPVRVIIRGDA